MSATTLAGGGLGSVASGRGRGREGWTCNHTSGTGPPDLQSPLPLGNQSNTINVHTDNKHVDVPNNQQRFRTIIKRLVSPKKLIYFIQPVITLCNI